MELSKQSMAGKLQRFIFNLFCRFYPRFPVQRALWMVRIYAGDGLSRKRLAMLENDAKRMAQKGRWTDALRILHCAMLLNPESKQTLRLAQELTTKKLKAKSSQDQPKSDLKRSKELEVKLEMEAFSFYVMQAVRSGSFSRAIERHQKSQK